MSVILPKPNSQKDYCLSLLGSPCESACELAYVSACGLDGELDGELDGVLACELAKDGSTIEL